MEIKQYIKENEPRMLDELFGLIRIPSISALPLVNAVGTSCFAFGNSPIRYEISTVAPTERSTPE